MRVHLSGRSLACAMACAAALLACDSTRAATITVNSTSDAAANDALCTLREAIIAANTDTSSGAATGECGAGAAGLDTIEFAIPGTGVHTIAPTTVLPTITSPVFIDGYTQPGSSANTNAMNAGINAVPQIELNLTSGGGLFFFTGSDGSTVRGLIVNRANSDQIVSWVSDTTIAGNFIGTNATGTAALTGSSGGFGVRIDRSAANATIGGPAPADRNLFSGIAQGGIILPFPSTTGHRIEGNYVGTDITGTAALGAGEGLDLVGGASVIDNLVSGNPNGGMSLLDNAIIRGNLIGTQRDGTSPLPNGNFGGVSIGGSGSTIGGSGAGQGNVIAFNVNSGIDSQNNVNSNRISQNSIYSNAALGTTLLHSTTPLANDACDADSVPGNHGQNYPVITSAPIAAGNVTISGTLNSAASTTFRVEFFSSVTADPSGNGEGQTFIGFANVTTDASCNASFGPLVFAVPGGQTNFSATATDPAGNTSEFSAAFSLATVSSADLLVTKTASPNPVAAGGNLTYSIGVANDGPSAAASVSLTDTLPANTTFVSFAVPSGWVSTTPAVGGTGLVTASSGSLVSGDMATFTLVVQVTGGAPDGTAISNTASVSSATGDPNGNNNSASATASVSAAGPPGPQAIPTLSSWAIATLTLLLAAFGWLGAARRRG